MNNYRNIVPFFYKWEGGLSRSLKDSASSTFCPKLHTDGKRYHTNKGVTYPVWVKHFGTANDHRFLKMNDEDWGVIFKAGFWDKVKGDTVPYQSISEVLVSWAWGSGPVTAVRQMQRLLNQLGGSLTRDGVIGPKTFAEIQKHDEKFLFDKCCEARESFFRFISDERNGRTAPEKERFKNNKANLRGWLNRLEEFKKTFRPA